MVSSLLNLRGFKTVSSEILVQPSIFLKCEDERTFTVHKYAVVCLDPVIVAVSSEAMVDANELTMYDASGQLLCKQKVRRIPVMPDQSLALYEVLDSRSTLRGGRLSTLFDDLILLLKNAAEQNPSNFKMSVTSLNRLFDCYLTPHPVYTLNYIKNDGSSHAIPIDLCMYDDKDFWFSLLISSRSVIELVPEKEVEIATVRWKEECNAQNLLHSLKDATENYLNGRIVAYYDLGSHRLFKLNVEQMNDSRNEGRLCHTPWFNTITTHG